ncbi:MAG: DNA gyrase subunit A [Armatimonadetes bacterium]|nr:DNA gyrase subunit A [Armatimonadota bacterium]
MADQYEAGAIEPIELGDEMTDSYTRYAMSVIMARALPDVRDGLKPSQRRILQAMHDDTLHPDRAHAKCAAIVGETMKTYHPHGDQSIYDTLVRMGQDFNARYPEVDPQGNFGSVDGDPAGAPRYTEARLSRVAMALLADLDMNTVDWQPNYNENQEEAQVLPGMFPRLLCNGASGIAVAYATEIPPHNLNEVVDGLIALIEDSDLDARGLMRHIQGPDFPTAGLILGIQGIREYFATGKGTIVMQARAVIEPLDRNRYAIIVTELPYQVGKSTLIQQIAKLVEAKKIEGISDLRDESDRKGMRVVIELKREANANVVLNQLYKRTSLRTNFNANMMALVPKGNALVPKLCSMKELLQAYLEHRLEVITRRTEFLLAKARARDHIVAGLLKAINVIDEVIAIVRASDNRGAARQALMDTFEFSELQAEAILSMQLGQLTRLSRIDLEKEAAGLAADIAEYESILASEERKFEVIKEELQQIAKDLGDDRRTTIIAGEAEDINTEDLIAREDMAITITRDGYIKRMPLDTYRLQHRGGRGVVALSKKEEDSVRDIFVATTHHLILVFTNQGRVYRLRAYQVPMASRTSRGTPIINLVPLESGEQVTAWVPVRDFDQGGYLVMVTRLGMIKKTSLKEYDTNLKAKGIIAINLRAADRLEWVMWTDGTRDIILATKMGKALRFAEKCVRPMGRSAAGVKAIKLQKNDELVSTESIRADDERDLLVVAERGLGKRTPLAEYRCQGRATQGVMTLKITSRNGAVIGVCVVDGDDEVMCISSGGVLIRVPVKGIRRTGRNAQGVKVVAPDEGTVVRALAKVVKTAQESPTGTVETEDAVGDDECPADDELDQDEVEELDEMDELDDETGDEGGVDEEPEETPAPKRGSGKKR